MFKSRVLGVAGALILLLALNVSVMADIKDDLTYQGNKARITVGKIKPKASKCSGAMAAAIGEMLSTSLTNTGDFIVLASQEEVAELAEEIEFAQSGNVEAGKGPEKGLMEGADLLITGSVTAFEPDAGGKGGILGGLKGKALGGIGASSKEAKIIMDIKLIDIRTRRILKAKSIEAKSRKWKVGMAGGSSVGDVVLGGALGMYSNEPMEKAIRTALAKMVELVSKEVPKEYYRYQGGGQYTQEYGAAAAGGSPASGGTDATVPAAPAVAPAAEDMTLYTKYDFVSGDKVIFYDDMAGEEEGEFPYRWDLERGVFEVVRLGKEFWIMCTDDGTIYPKTPIGPLPEQYTVELEFYDNGPDKRGHYFYIRWFDDRNQYIGELGIVSHKNTWLTIRGKTLANKDLTKKLDKGVHTMRIMATKRSIKCYLDEVRVANVPKVEGFNPARFGVYLRPYEDNPCLFRGFRYAEGGKSMREQLDETGKIITHGILFDPDAYKIKGESFKTLQNIGRLLEDDPDLRLSIEGHTDSDGSDDHNQVLSQKRAESVRNYLISIYGIAADRLEAKGWGEAQPIDVNTSAEGKANNRRVELVKL